MVTSLVPLSRSSERKRRSNEVQPKRILDFFFLMGNWPFLKLENVLFDGTGWTGWTDGLDGRVGRDIKSVLQFSSYFVGI